MINFILHKHPSQTDIQLLLYRVFQTQMSNVSFMQSYCQFQSIAM